MSPERVLQLRNLRRLLVILSWASAALNAGWGAYLLLTPAAQFQASPVWRSALSVTPGGDPAWLGLAFVISGVLLAAAMPVHMLRPLGWLALVLGVSLWLILAGSFSYAAANNGGLGAGNVVQYLFASVVLTALAYARHE